MATLDSPSARSNRIENAVERELARRRRLLRFYLLLLLVPLGLAAWFLAAGRSDHESVRQTLDMRVAPVEERYAEIAPKLDQVEGLNEALPIVRKAAAQLQAQEKQVETLEQQVKEIVPAVKEIEANQASQDSLLRTALASKPPSEELNRLSARLTDMERSIATVQARQVEVQRDLKAVQLKVDRQPAGPADRLDPKELNALIDARLRALQQRGRGLVQPPPQ